MACAAGLLCAMIFGGTTYTAQGSALPLQTDAEVATYRYLDAEWPKEVGALSSVKVPSGLTVTMYTDAACTADPHVYTHDMATLPGFNDKAQCIQVRHALTIYGDTGYGARRENLSLGMHNLPEWQRTVGGVSSLRIGPGIKVTLYTDLDGAGESTVLTASTDRLSGKWNDKAHSIKVEEVTP